MQSYSRIFILKIGQFCFLCVGSVGWHTYRIRATATVGCKAKYDFSPLFLFMSCAHKRQNPFACAVGFGPADDNAEGGRCLVEQRMGCSACGFVISSLWPRANYLTSLLPFPLLPRGDNNNIITGWLWVLISIYRVLWRWKVFNGCWVLLKSSTFSKCY